MEYSTSQRLSEPVMQGSIDFRYATQPRSYCVPAPPHVMVPPPIFAGEEVAKGRLRTFPSAFYSGLDLEALPLLEKINYEGFFAANKVHDWKYAFRRQSQRILPFLYLGPLASARDKTFLSQEGITLLLAVRNTVSAQAKCLDGTKIANDLGIESCSIDVPAGNYNWLSVHSQAVQTINAHISKIYRRNTQINKGESQTMSVDGDPSSDMGKVLVYCESGNERSAAVVAVYLLTMYDLTHIQAIQLIQMQRFCAAFDEMVKTLLKNHVEILTAKRDVLNASSSQSAASCIDGPGGMVRKRSKRALDEDEDDDEDAEMEDAGASGNHEEATLGQRAGCAPFQECTFIH